MKETKEMKDTKKIFMRVEYIGEPTPGDTGIEGDGRLQSSGTMLQTELMAANIIETLAGGLFENIVEFADKTFPKETVETFAAARIMEILFRGYTEFVDQYDIDFETVSAIADVSFAWTKEGGADNEALS